MRRPYCSALAALVICSAVSACSWHTGPVRRVNYADSIIHYPGDGGVVISSGRLSPKSICVAPPAQGALLRTTDTSAGAKVDVIDVVGVGVQIDHSAAEALARMYEQNERSLFLQYSLYRLCEAYMNGMLTPSSGIEILKLEQAKLVAAADAATAKRTECTATQKLLKESSAPAAEVQLEQLDCKQHEKDAQSAKATADLIGKRIEAMESGSKQSDPNIVYWLAFQQILDTAVELARLDAQAAKLRAETEAALAKKAQLEAETKAKNLEASKKKLDEVREQALDNELERAKCAQGCGDKKTDGDKKSDDQKQD